MPDRALITDEELHAYIDGELDAVRAADVAVVLQYRPELQAKVAAFRADKAMLAQAYGPLIDQPIPQAWHGLIARGRRSAVPLMSRRNLFAAAASVAVAVVGVQAYRRLVPDAEDKLIAEAFAARDEVLNLTLAGPVVRDEADRALKAALELSIRTPDMSRHGFALTRFRVYNGVTGGRAVKLDYEDAQKRVFTMYLKHSDGEPRFDMLKRGEVRICVWQDEVLSTVMLAAVNASEMGRLAALAYDGLTA